MESLINLAEVLRSKRLLIFDFDGTVADTSPLHAKTFKHTLAPFGVSVHYPDIAGLKTRDAMLYCLDQPGISLDAAVIDTLVSEKQVKVRQLIKSDLEPMPGVDAFLRWARRRFQLAMVTSGSRGSVSLALEKLGYTGWFDPLICAEDVTNAKPIPEGYLKVLNLTQTKPNEAIVFEDSNIGIASAKSAGLEAIDIRKIELTIIR